MVEDKNNSYNHQMWIDLIETSLNQVKKRNTAYSARALARDLNISQSLMIKIINGKRKVTPGVGLRIALHLGLPHEKTIELMVSTL